MMPNLFLLIELPSSQTRNLNRKFSKFSRTFPHFLSNQTSLEPNKTKEFQEPTYAWEKALRK